MTIAAAAGTVALVSVIAPGAASANTRTTQVTTQILLPSNAGPAGAGFLYGVDCLATGSCVAGGGYTDSSSRTEAMIARESSGHWARAHELTMPSNANVNPDALVNAVSCTGTVTCVAVGEYFSGTRYQGFVATESASGWARAHRITPPSNSAASTDYRLAAVACTGPGACVAVGSYKDKLGHDEGLEVTESGGKWAQAGELRLPSNAQANPQVSLFAVSCVRASSCSAAGRYADSAGATQALVVSKSNGSWRQGIKITPPPGAGTDPIATATSVACTGVGACTAVGPYADSLFNSQSLVVTESAGSWARARKVAIVPSNAAPHPQVDLHSVTCVRAGACAAVGGYLVTSGGSASYAALEIGGKWVAAKEIFPPSNSATGSSLSTQVESVSCTPTGYCVAAGFYLTKAGREEPMAAATPVP